MRFQSPRCKMLNFIRVLFVAVLGLVVIASFFDEAAAQKPWNPAPVAQKWWMDRHRANVLNTRENGHAIRALFVGSSVMEFWGTEGAEIWNSKYALLGGVNYGISGDRTEHLLWRLQNGEIDGLNPKVAVIYIGSNNVPAYSNNTEVVMGVRAVVDTLRAKLPSTRLLYMGIFPRGDVNPVVGTFERILAINDELGRMDHDGDFVHILSIFWDLAASMGQLRDELYLSDRLHLTSLGYAQWDRSMNETFQRLWNW